MHNLFHHLILIFLHMILPVFLNRLTNQLLSGSKNCPLAMAAVKWHQSKIFERWDFLYQRFTVSVSEICDI